MNRRKRVPARARRGAAGWHEGCSKVRMLTLALVTLGFSSAAWLVAREINQAPLGEETEMGFELAWCNDRPETRDVSCVWRVMGEMDGLAC
jgi:hypothetical protein